MPAASRIGREKGNPPQANPRVMEPGDRGPGKDRRSIRCPARIRPLQRAFHPAIDIPTGVPTSCKKEFQKKASMVNDMSSLAADDPSRDSRQRRTRPPARLEQFRPVQLSSADSQRLKSNAWHPTGDVATGRRTGVQESPREGLEPKPSFHGERRVRFTGAEFPGGLPSRLQSSSGGRPDGFAFKK